MTVKILHAEKHEVIETDDGSKGVEMALKEKPDCIFLDLLMPKVSGFEVLTSFKEKGLNIPVIVLSADIQETAQRKCLEFGAFDFIFLTRWRTNYNGKCKKENIMY